MPRVCSSERSERSGEAEAVKLAAIDVAGALREDVIAGRSEGRSGALVVWIARVADGEASVRRRGRRNERNMVAVGWVCGGRVGGEVGWKKCQECTGGWGVVCRADGRCEVEGCRC